MTFQAPNLIGHERLHYFEICCVLQPRRKKIKLLIKKPTNIYSLNQIYQTKSTKSNVFNQNLNHNPHYKTKLPHKILKSKTEPPIIPQSAVKRKTDPPVVGSSMLMVPTVTGNIRIS